LQRPTPPRRPRRPDPLRTTTPEDPDPGVRRQRQLHNRAPGRIRTCDARFRNLIRGGVAGSLLVVSALLSFASRLVASRRDAPRPVAWMGNWMGKSGFPALGYTTKPRDGGDGGLSE